MLLGAHKRAGAANLQVAHGDAHAAAQVLELGKCGQARRRLLGEWQLAREHKVRVGLRGRATHTALELIELRQTQALRILDDQRVGGRVVDTALHDGRGDEHVDLLVANSIIDSSTSRGLILPCATPTRASGAASCTRATRRRWS